MLVKIKKIATMRKTILLIAVILTLIMTGFCQSDNTTILTSIDRQSNTTDNVIKYYFTSMQADSSVFSRDTLKLVKTEINKDFPRFEFNSDFRFSFFYDNYLGKRNIRNLTTGELVEIVAQKSKKIQGVWKTNDIQKNISLTLTDKLIVNYSIIEGNKFIYFIRVK